MYVNHGRSHILVCFVLPLPIVSIIRITNLPTLSDSYTYTHAIHLQLQCTSFPRFYIYNNCSLLPPFALLQKKPLSLILSTFLLFGHRAHQGARDGWIWVTEAGNPEPPYFVSVHSYAPPPLQDPLLPCLSFFIFLTLAPPYLPSPSATPTYLLSLWSL